MSVADGVDVKRTNSADQSGLSAGKAVDRQITETGSGSRRDRHLDLHPDKA